MVDFKFSGITIVAGLFFLAMILTLAACGASGATSAAPVTPDPQRPTFILFFTDP